MAPGKDGPSGQNIRACLRICRGLWVGVLAGCAIGRPHLDRELLAERGTGTRNEGVAECYLVHSPDVLEVTVQGRPEESGQQVIALDGRVDMGRARGLRVEGRTVPECARLIAEGLGVPPSAVQVRVADFRSQHVYLFGPGLGLQRAVAYKGPETVLDLLQRTGGIEPGAAPNDVYVVRPGVAEGRRPQVFHINLSAILLKKDQHTNLRLQPFDEVFIGETRESSVAKCVPPCLRPLYETLWDLKSNPAGGKKAKANARSESAARNKE